jgi:hypothetical protein
VGRREGVREGGRGEGGVDKKGVGVECEPSEMSDHAGRASSFPSVLVPSLPPSLPPSFRTHR